MRAAAFVKRLPLAERWRLEAEADGLGRLARADAIRVPRVLGIGASGAECWLELERFELREPDARAQARLGEALAGLHAVTGPSFGLERDNAIGATPQPNGPCGDWAAFWRDRRLGFQLELAARNGYRGRLQERGSRLLESVPALLAGHEPQPSLLHGDLWPGNRGMLPDGTPVAFDPAVYYGDREADLAMTELFGGFPDEFYSAYEKELPLDSGYESRKHLYNLYHLLNHLNLFGSGYRRQVEETLGLLRDRL